VKDTLLRDDAADQKGDEQDDGHRLPADAIELMHGGGEPEVARPREHTHRGNADSPEHVGEAEKVASDPSRPPADGPESDQEPIFACGRS